MSGKRRKSSHQLDMQEARVAVRRARKDKAQAVKAVRVAVLKMRARHRAWVQSERERHCKRIAEARLALKHAIADLRYTARVEADELIELAQLKLEKVKLQHQADRERARLERLWAHSEDEAELAASVGQDPVLMELYKRNRPAVRAYWERGKFGGAKRRKGERHWSLLEAWEHWLHEHPTEYWHVAEKRTTAPIAQLEQYEAAIDEREAKPRKSVSAAIAQAKRKVPKPRKLTHFYSVGHNTLRRARMLVSGRAGEAMLARLDEGVGTDADMRELARLLKPTSPDEARFVLDQLKVPTPF